MPTKCRWHFQSSEADSYLESQHYATFHVIKTCLTEAGVVNVTASKTAEAIILVGESAAS